MSETLYRLSTLTGQVHGALGRRSWYRDGKRRTLASLGVLLHSPISSTTLSTIAKQTEAYGISKQFGDLFDCYVLVHRYSVYHSSWHPKKTAFLSSLNNFPDPSSVPSSRTSNHMAKRVRTAFIVSNGGHHGSCKCSVLRTRSNIVTHRLRQF